MSATNIKEAVKEKYGQAALRVVCGQGNSCCGGASACGTDIDPITANLYGDAEKGVLPEQAVLASLGCGNPTALAELREGETVLDLGSGGGIDVLLSARRVGPTGKAYGLDMTDDMLALARENQRKAGATNVEFLKGEIEQIPLPDNSVDVIISNCVINLSADKDRVLREAFRVLKPGKRFAVSDVVTRGAIPEGLRRDMLLWVGCIAGALDENDYRMKLAAAGFEAICVEPTRIYKVDDARIPFRQGGRRGHDRASRRRQIHERVRARQKAGPTPERAGLLRNLRRKRCPNGGTMSCSCAPATAPARSWPKAFCGKWARDAFRHSRPEATPRGRSIPSPSKCSKTMNTRPTASGRKAGTNSQAPALQSWISSSPSATPPRPRRARSGQASR